jgi:hypothetical protein
VSERTELCLDPEDPNFTQDWLDLFEFNERLREAFEREPTAKDEQAP